MSDLISRQAVDELSKELVHTTRDKADFLCNFWERLQKLPSVENNGDLISKQEALKPYEKLNDTDVISVWLIRKNLEEQEAVNADMRINRKKKL